MDECFSINDVSIMIDEIVNRFLTIIRRSWERDAFSDRRFFRMPNAFGIINQVNDEILDQAQKRRFL